MILIACSLHRASHPSIWPGLIFVLVLVAALVTPGNCMSDEAILALRQDTRNLFYHGYSNYLAHAFPEDELKPISCRPQTRNREDPADIGLNDVLGNYSLTLVDSLSSLAILASEVNETDSHDALQDFQNGVRALVELYGNGREGDCGTRACAFDLDSKVQVFETNIRGVGGLLSAHLFAIGELPIRGYQPAWVEMQDGLQGVDWHGWTYDGQLLRLAHDLAQRLLPAFKTDTGLPYPRVNLRTGIPFYQNAGEGICHLDGTSSQAVEITETCAAGAGSLVLEFSTITRLTGDTRFESLAKKAFWAVWHRRSPIGLVGAGVDAESGHWVMPPLAGIGAGIDSFLEYALKSHILLSNLPYEPDDGSPDKFLLAWEQAHAAIKRHVYRDAQNEKHPFYGQADLVTGAPRYGWIDNLSAYYPGLLTLAGELEEAMESHLLYAALWTRYAALPERWHVFNAYIDPNFKHWAGRPEFIESTYHLYQATKDPYYLHVGEMALRDIRRRCWTKCGWADLGDVVSGEQRDRMESFFLGETAKYLYLLFEPTHPLNHLDVPFVFTTEGHPLTIPKTSRHAPSASFTREMPKQNDDNPVSAATCPIPPSPLPLTVSNVADRDDLFHAAALVQLHRVPVNPARSSPILKASANAPGISISDVRSPTNYTFYPWTLPSDLIPRKGFSGMIRSALVSTLTFPNLSPGAAANGENGMLQLGALQKVIDGVLIKSLSNIRLNMVEEPRSMVLQDGDGVMVEMEVGKEFRVHGIANWPLGRDEKVLLSNEALQGVSPVDPHFTRIKDREMVDLIVDVGEQLTDEVEGLDEPKGDDGAATTEKNTTTESFWDDVEAVLANLLGKPNAQTRNSGKDKKAQPDITQVMRYTIPAILPTGAGAAPLPSTMDTDTDPTALPSGALPYKTIFFLDDPLCTHHLPAAIAKSNTILIVKRGGCSFNDKLANIPSFPPSHESLQLVVVISVLESEPEPHRAGTDGDIGPSSEDLPLMRPLLEEPQRTPHGFERRHPLAMVMVDGSRETEDTLRRTSTSSGTFGADGELVEQRTEGMQQGRATGLAVKRRFWFESLGVPIANLLML